MPIKTSPGENVDSLRPMTTQNVSIILVEFLVILLFH